MKTVLHLFTQIGIVTALFAPVSITSTYQKISGTSIEVTDAAGSATMIHLIADGLLEDRSMGKSDALVTVIVYSSLTCPHCAEFHTMVLPKFKTHYIDTKKVKFVYRDFPLDPLATAAAMLTRCASSEMYFRFLDALFISQSTWTRASKPRQALVTLARLGGMTDMEVNQCLSDTTLLAGLGTVKNEASGKYGVKAAPSFIINGQTYIGITSYDVLAEIIESQLSNTTKTPPQ